MSGRGCDRGWVLGPGCSMPVSNMPGALPGDIAGDNGGIAGAGPDGGCMTGDGKGGRVIVAVIKAAA